MHFHLVCGLTVATDLSLSGSENLISPPAIADVTVRRAPVAHSLEAPTFVGPTWQVTNREFLLDLPGLLRMRVRDGSEVTVEPAADIPDADVAPFILSTGLGALLHQRGILALHASTVNIGGRVVALCGATGTGKSTLAAELCRHGATFVGDDVAAIHPAADGTPQIHPDGRQHRLWADAIQHLDMKDKQGPAIRAHLNKFHVPPTAQSTAIGPTPLAAVVLLRPHSPLMAPSPPVITRLGLTDAAPLLAEDVFRAALARRMNRQAALFGQVAALLGRVPVFLLERSPGFQYLPETVRAVTSLWSKGT